MRFRRSTKLLFWVLIAYAVLFVMSVNTVPPQAETYGNMHMMKRRILRYATTHDSLPTSLDQLPEFEGKINSVTDGWGRPIEWRVEGEQVVLTSFGRDGRPGGSGKDADMIGVFRVKTADGRWAEELCEWQVDPYSSAK
jgi:hypothetical protein